MDRALFLGPPGCGKTTKLLAIIAEELSRGVRPSEIAFATFTTRGVSQGKDRASSAFHLDPKRELPWFRTVHSLCYAQLGIARDEVMTEADWQDFSRYVGYSLTGKFAVDEAVGDVAPDGKGDAMLRVLDFSAATELSLWSAYQTLDAAEGIAWHEMKLFAECYDAFKRTTGKLDFSDMLSRYATSGTPLTVKVAIIDEAQDLTRAQWHVVYRAFANVDRLYVAGDDDQSIYKWAGADIAAFLSLDMPRTVLSQSHRLLPEIQSYSQEITARIQARFDKPFLPREGRGVVDMHATLDELDFGHGTWFVLARNGYQLQAAEAIMRERGYLYTTRRGSSAPMSVVQALFQYEAIRSGKATTLSAKEARVMAPLLGVPVPAYKESARVPLGALRADLAEIIPIWHEAMVGLAIEQREYLIGCLKNREKFQQAPRIALQTIHAVKGDEVEHVALLTDVSRKTYQGMLTDPDAEHRVFYVATTRAMESLHIIEPRTDRYYEMPPV